MPIVDADRWSEFLHDHPDAHLLQSKEWGELKREFGWEPVHMIGKNCGAQILFRRLPLGISIGYIPKGPVGSDWGLLWPEIDQVCRKHRAVFLKVEPDNWEPAPGEIAGVFSGWVPSAPVQPRRTVEVDLSGEPEAWLARMKQKTRYNIHLAERKGVEVAPSEDIDNFHRLMLLTGERDSFGVHSLEYYQRVYDLFKPQDKVELLSATYAGELLAALMVFRQAERAWYFYGASSNAERNRMPTYLLQWQAMTWAAEYGCRIYDLWGVPDVDEDRLEGEFAGRGDGLWGVYRFKRGFGGIVRRSIGAWDRVYQPGLYRLYQLLSRWRGGFE